MYIDARCYQSIMMYKPYRQLPAPAAYAHLYGRGLCTLQRQRLRTHRLSCTSPSSNFVGQTSLPSTLMALNSVKCSLNDDGRMSRLLLPLLLFFLLVLPLLLPLLVLLLLVLLHVLVLMLLLMFLLLLLHSYPNPSPADSQK